MVMVNPRRAIPWLVFAALSVTSVALLITERAKALRDEVVRVQVVEVCEHSVFDEGGRVVLEYQQLRFLFELPPGYAFSDEVRPGAAFLVSRKAVPRSKSDPRFRGDSCEVPPAPLKRRGTLPRGAKVA
jgi:hypothetical protein